MALGANLLVKISCLSVLAFSAPALSGCQTVTETACVNADWHDFGYKDGKEGRDDSGFANSASNCSSNLDGKARRQYVEGYVAGIQDYCVYKNGYKAGKRGGNYPDVCSWEAIAPLEASFRAGYERGRSQYFEDFKVRMNAERSQ